MWACVYMYLWIRCRVNLYRYVFFSDVLTNCVMLQAFICYCSYVKCLWCVCVCVCVVVVVVFVHWHCSSQLSMFNMEKRYRNKIITIINLVSYKRGFLKTECLISKMLSDCKKAIGRWRQRSHHFLSMLCIRLHVCVWGMGGGRGCAQMGVSV